MRVLLVASYKPILWALRRGLEEEGWDVQLLQDVSKVMTTADSCDPQVLVFDVLPQQDATSLLHQWRRDGLSLPVLALTTVPDEVKRIQRMDNGAQAALAKPFGWESLVSQLRELVG